MATHCQTATPSGNGEFMPISRGDQLYIEGQTMEWSTSNENLIRVVICKICLFSLYFVKLYYMIFITRNASWKNLLTFLHNCVLRKYDFRRQWSATLKIREQPNKT